MTQFSRIHFLHVSHSLSILKMSLGLSLPQSLKITVLSSVEPCLTRLATVFLLSVQPKPPQEHLAPQQMMLPTSDEQLQSKVSPCHGQKRSAQAVAVCNRTNLHCILGAR